MYVCSCFGITEKQVREHASTGACTPRQIAGACGAGTDCGSCVRRIQALLGRGGCESRGRTAAERTAGAGRVAPGRAEPIAAAGTLGAAGAAGPAGAAVLAAGAV
ncbi:(2Fe-2S)-binding protein [Streptomyces sp. B1866]|uniref:(2Fe-2S)-binding protein n=1 Tax=Streptomyces sp. B1866 TaxID=3075431 RepID=UPI0028928DB3|nr:(2Fe-2S)-binding protein [Streptomyces sp. B1866]MDT3400144.1 (2Fe-2S)-binding protein [Streptomyces sp. B1866]